MDFERRRVERSGRDQLGFEPDFSNEEADKLHIQLPERPRAGVQDGEKRVAVILEERRGHIGRVDAALGLAHPGSAVVHLDLGNRDAEGAPDVAHRETQGLDAVLGVDVAAVAVRLLLVILAGLDINRRIPCKDCKVFYRWKICDWKRRHPTQWNPWSKNLRHGRCRAWSS